MIFSNSFKVHDLVGEGLNAKVYRVTETSKEFKFQQTYALKVLKRKEDYNHFKKEFKTLSSVEGKHLVKLLGWRKYRAKPALLLEYIEGSTLHDLFQNQIALSASECKWIYQEVLSGLKELKSSHLYHGDLSPKNIMISTKGEIKLIDFGLSRWRTQKVELTPEFAAPEAFQTHQPTFQQDLYSLDKIFDVLSLDKPTSNESMITKPLSLSSKIEGFLYKDSQTEEFSATSSLSDSKIKSQSGILSYLLKSSLVPVFGLFYMPVSAPNLYHKDTETFIRSTKWLAVKSDLNHQDWCFTPCTLKFKNLGPNTIYWRSKDRDGYTRVFIQKQGQTLVLTP